MVSAPPPAPPWVSASPVPRSGGWPVARRVALIVTVLAMLVPILEGLRGLLRQVYFEPTDDALYTAWVYRPLIPAAIVGFLVLVAAVILIGLARGPGRRPIPVTIAALVAAGLAVGIGVHASHVRLGGSHDVLTAARSIPVPADAQQVAPAALLPRHPFPDVVSPPEAVVRWVPAAGRDACADVRRVAATASGWRPTGACSYVRQLRGMSLFLGETFFPGSDARGVQVTVTVAHR